MSYDIVGARHRVIWHNEVLASRFHGIYSKGFCCRWKHGGNDRILASECNVVIRTQIRSFSACVLLTSAEPSEIMEQF